MYVVSALQDPRMLQSTCRWATALCTLPCTAAAWHDGAGQTLTCSCSMLGKLTTPEALAVQLSRCQLSPLPDRSCPSLKASAALELLQPDTCLKILQYACSAEFRASYWLRTDEKSSTAYCDSILLHLLQAIDMTRE